MTLRTGKNGRCRYYSCSTKARMSKEGCTGATAPMAKLDDAVVDHLERRLLGRSAWRSSWATCSTGAGNGLNAVGLT